MFVTVVIGIILLIIVSVIYIEYRNNQRYEAKRKAEKKSNRKLTPKVTKRKAPPLSKTHQRPTDTLKKQKSKPSVEPQKKKNVSYETKAEKSTTEFIKTKTVSPQAIQPAEQKKKTSAKQEAVLKEKVFEKELPKTETAPKTETRLPKCEYPDFNYNRLIEMGLSKEEALEFIQELIPQIGDQIPLIEEAMKIPDFYQMERLTHSIKGSSTTIGTGGVSDLLVDYNTYLKTGKELPVAQTYQKYLKIYFEKLKKQFPPKS
ncbi:COG1565: Uncharacterized conserved protein [hydrothermal vent metagenome]|uniref:COG1565: Uncharacterized conserved protein n=1 Tax=hydrothermal vent metagenome TaxID=652676 RepID=A0A1W1E7T3_9ZZZZ